VARYRYTEEDASDLLGREGEPVACVKEQHQLFLAFGEDAHRAAVVAQLASDGEEAPVAETHLGCHACRHRLTAAAARDMALSRRVVRNVSAAL